MARTPYTPPEDRARLYARHRKARETVAELKDPVREAAALDLHAGATTGELAKITGLSDEYFRRIAREEGIELRRPPTVRRLADDDGD